MSYTSSSLIFTPPTFGKLSYILPIIPTYFREIFKELLGIGSFNFFKSSQTPSVYSLPVLAWLHIYCVLPYLCSSSSTVEVEVSSCSQALVLNKSTRKDMLSGLTGQKYVKHTPAGSKFLLTYVHLANSQTRNLEGHKSAPSCPEVNIAPIKAGWDPYLFSSTLYCYGPGCSGRWVSQRTVFGLVLHKEAAGICILVPH